MNIKSQNRRVWETALMPEVWNIENLSFEIVSDFVLRISDFFVLRPCSNERIAADSVRSGEVPSELTTFTADCGFGQGLTGRIERTKGNQRAGHGNGSDEEAVLFSLKGLTNHMEPHQDFRKPDSDREPCKTLQIETRFCTYGHIAESRASVDGLLIVAGDRFS